MEQYFEKSIARIKKLGKDFEIIIDDVEKALYVREAIKKAKKEGKLNNAEIREAIEKICPINQIFFDEKKGLRPSQTELQEAFGTLDFFEIAKEIIENGELVLPAEFRKKLREQKFKQIVAFLSKNAVDPRTKTLHPPDRIEAALRQVGAKIDEFKSVDEQLQSIINQLSRILPLKIENRKIEIIVPAAFTGKVYGLLAKYEKQKEEWMDDGSLKVIIVLPTAIQPEFFDKLNKATNGTALTRDLGEV